MPAMPCHDMSCLYPEEAAVPIRTPSPFSPLIYLTTSTLRPNEPLTGGFFATTRLLYSQLLRCTFYIHTHIRIYLL
jgi:hypothetical protein